MTKRVLRERRYAISFALLIPAVASFLFLLPVWLTPGNSVSFQVSFFRPQDVDSRRLRSAGCYYTM